MISFPLASLVLLAALPRAQDDARQTYDLGFAPANRTLVVAYQEDESWNYDASMNGKLHTELELRWGFEKTEKGPRAKAAFTSVVYRGEGVKQDRNWKHDILWKRGDGYARGAGSEAAKKWVDRELKEGVELLYDKRGEVKPGAC